MLSSWLISVALADCPAVDLTLKRAEEDAVQYFLADAQKGLQQAVKSFGCNRITEEELVRFWLTRAMIANLSEQDERTTLALAAAKALRPKQFTKALGDELKVLWSGTDPAPLSPSVDLEIKGLKRSDIVLVDNLEADPPNSPPGLHLVQVVREDTVVLGRIITAEVGKELTISLNTKDDEPDSTRPAAGPRTITGLGFTAPIQTKLGRYYDADETRLSMNRDILPIALLNADGRKSWNRRRRNTALQATAGVLAVGGVGLTALVASTAPSTNEQDRFSATILLSAVTLAPITWEFVLQSRRKRFRRELMEHANAEL